MEFLGAYIPKEYLAPHSDGGGGVPRNLPTPDRHATAEGFAAIPFYRVLNIDHLEMAPKGLHRLVDLGTGPGSVLEWAMEVGVLTEPFSFTGYDINGDDLAVGRERFAELATAVRGNRIEFIERSAENTGLPESSTPLVTSLNWIHLNLEGPLKVHQEAFRILENGGTYLVSSAYVKGLGVPDRETLTQWLRFFKNAQAFAREAGVTDIPNPPDLAKYTADQHVEMLRTAGFDVEQPVRRIEKIAYDQAIALVKVPEFYRGVLPGVASDIAEQAVEKAMIKTLDDIKSPTITRGWGLFKATARKAA